MTKLIDLAGKKFGRWFVLSKAEASRNGHTRWNCLCECGTTKIVYGVSLSKGVSKSCGCYTSEVTTKRNYRHGQRRTKEYDVWCAMIARCNNKNNKAYFRYGEAGIDVSERWKNSFESFLEDMGPRPGNEYSLDRIDGTKGYSKENCRWATNSLQGYNQKLRKTNKSGVKGVSWRGPKGARRGRWTVSIAKDGKRISLGSFQDFDKAVQARKEAELKYYGESS